MDRIQRLMQAGGMGGGAGGGQPDAPAVDTAELVYISSMALLKMLKHGRAGVPMEVMGLMLGDFVDDYTVKCVDVFAMPQSGTGVSVEAVDPVFQTKMLEMLKQTGRPEMVVGWYHSHPGFGCWLSGVDVNTQQSFEALNQRAVAVVVDPIQSVKGKVVIDCFRSINPQMIMLGQEPRQTTSNLGHLNKPSIQALIHGLNRHYYSIAISYRKNELEQQMLQNLHKKAWTDGLKLTDYKEHAEETGKARAQSPRPRTEREPRACSLQRESPAPAERERESRARAESPARGIREAGSLCAARVPFRGWPPHARPPLVPHPWCPTLVPHP
jgi:26S proteasome regulatory subunit N11